MDLFKPTKNKSLTAEPSDESQITSSETSGSSGDSSIHLPMNAIVLNSKRSPEHHKADNSNEKDCDNSNSMSKLHLSREDNPAMSHSKGNKNHYELGNIQPSHSQNIPLGGTKAALPSSVANTNLDHSHLIRSPPPSLKKVTSTSSKVLNMEKDHDKLEEDAATILAIQRSTPKVSPPKFVQIPTTHTLLAPMSLQPIGRGADEHLQVC